MIIIRACKFAIARGCARVCCSRWRCCCVGDVAWMIAFSVVFAVLVCLLERVLVLGNRLIPAAKVRHRPANNDACLRSLQIAGLLTDTDAQRSTGLTSWRTKSSKTRGFSNARGQSFSYLANR